MNTLTEVDIKNLLALIASAPIKGNEAMTVALLQNKLQAMLTPIAEVTPTLAAKESENGQSTGTAEVAPTSAN